MSLIPLSNRSDLFVTVDSADVEWLSGFRWTLLTEEKAA